jgi:hypothetical protein
LELSVIQTLIPVLSGTAISYQPSLILSLSLFRVPLRARGMRCPLPDSVTEDTPLFATGLCDGRHLVDFHQVFNLFPEPLGPQGLGRFTLGAFSHSDPHSSALRHCNFVSAIAHFEPLTFPLAPQSARYALSATGLCDGRHSAVCYRTL